MKVSVIIPTYNREQLLKETINAIQNQTFKDFEIIIVDNYSKDNTKKLVDSYKDQRLSYFKNQNNGIVAVNRNFGIKKSKGEYIAFCDDDDLWLPDKLEKQLMEFTSDKKLGLVCTNGFSFSEVGIHKRLLKPKDKFISFKQLLFENTIVSCSVMVKNKVLKDVGLFDESHDVLTGEDYELWLRVANKYKIKQIGDFLVKYRVHAGTFQSTYLRGTKPLEVMQKVYKKLLEKKIINSDLYKKSCDRLNHRILTLRLIDGNDKVDLDTILKNEMRVREKSRVIIIYFLFKMGLLNILRRIRQNF